MKPSAINASRPADQTASGALIELGEDSATGRHILEVGGLVVATGTMNSMMAGIYLLLIDAAAPVVTALVDQVMVTGPIEIV